MLEVTTWVSAQLSFTKTSLREWLVRHNSDTQMISWYMNVFLCFDFTQYKYNIGVRVKYFIHISHQSRATYKKHEYMTAHARNRGAALDSTRFTDINISANRKVWESLSDVANQHFQPNTWGAVIGQYFSVTSENFGARKGGVDRCWWRECWCAFCLPWCFR